MSEKHTQGRMVARAWTSHAKTTIGFEESDGNFMAIADVCDFGRLSEHDENDARRLVACWNACEQITTEELEEIPNTGGMLGPRADVARIASQRDELLAALEKLSAINLGMFANGIVDKAIAKVKGGAK